MKNAITPPIRQAFLRRFLESWEGRTLNPKPVCFWLREYDFVKNNGPVSAPQFQWAQRVWILNDAGLEEKSPLDWRRFEMLVAHFQVRPFHRGPHDIAMGCFAPMQDGSFYADEIWGGLDGFGVRCVFDAEFQILKCENLWRC